MHESRSRTWAAGGKRFMGRGNKKLADAFSGVGTWKKGKERSGEQWKKCRVGHVCDVSRLTSWLVTRWCALDDQDCFLQWKVFMTLRFRFYPFLYTQQQLAVDKTYWMVCAFVWSCSVLISAKVLITVSSVGKRPEMWYSGHQKLAASQQLVQIGFLFTWHTGQMQDSSTTSVF